MDALSRHGKIVRRRTHTGLQGAGSGAAHPAPRPRRRRGTLRARRGGACTSNSLTQIVAFIAGYVRQDLALTMYLFFASCILSLLVCRTLTQLCVPAWPMYNRYHVAWLAPSHRSA